MVNFLMYISLDNVSTCKYNSDMVKAIVTKTGNSYALRVPKRYIDANHLKLGDEVEIEEPIVRQRQALAGLLQLANKRGPVEGMADPVEWQREQRHSSDPWKEIRDSSR
jgi:antitoxin component of MazEF toxin-antitoxin module